MTPPAKLHLVSNEALLPAQPSELGRAWLTGHDVQFYEKEDFLYASVANFLTEGARAGQPLIVVATKAHRENFAERMSEKGVDVGSLADGRDVVWLDARETLSAFMEGPMPNRELFEATVGNVFEKVISDRRYMVVRAYGEMVDLLWNDGNTEGALALEELWNELAAKYSFSLLCGYSMDSSFKEAHTESFKRICAHHARVLPMEMKQA